MEINKNWTFPTLVYKRPDIEAFKFAMEQYTKELAEAKDYETLKKVYLASEDLSEYSLMYTIAYVRNTIDTTDKFYEEEVAFWHQTFPTLQPLSIAFNEALYNSPFRADFEKEFGHQIFVGMELQKKSFCPENIPLMQQEAMLCAEYQKIMATCQIDFKGEKCNLYGIQKHLEDDDRADRESALHAWSNFYKANEKRIYEIWDELIKIRNQMGKNLGFENFIPLGYMQQGRTDYGPKEVASYREQVKKDLVPFCQKLYEWQKARLGYDKLYMWDEKRVFADGNAHPLGNEDFMIEKAREMYHKISPDTGEFIDFMIEHELMDLKNKPGKASTGYMTGLEALKAPFVFSCLNGTIFDMEVLSHELGHAFAAYEASRNQPISAYYGESTDIAEIHSMSMEQFAYPYAELFFGKEADKYRFGHLQEAITFVPYGVAVDEFQHICYEHPELTAEERTAEWKKLEQIYMPWRDYGDDDFFGKGGMWAQKLHIFLYPMYYINYTLTTMGAMEFKEKMAKNPTKAWEDYMNLCQVGGSRSYLETLKFANVSNPFEDGAVKKCTAFARETLEKQKDNF